EYLSPEASRVLSALGVLQAVEDAGAAQLDGMVVRAPGGRSFHGAFAAARGFRGFRDRGLALRRRALDPIVLGAARAHGARVVEGAKVTALATAQGRVSGVVCEEAGRRVVRRAQLVIGADGLRSIVARRLGLAAHAWWPRRVAFVAHYRGVSGMGRAGEMHVEANGYVGLADVGHGETNVAIVVPSRFARDASGDAAGFMDRWLARRTHLRSRFAHAERTGTVRATGPFASRARRAWAPGAALVGDAADFFDPFTGEGIYAALRGGELLAPFAAAALRGTPREQDAALAAYDTARRREFAAKWRVERIIAAAVASPPLMNHAARVLGRAPHLADLLVGVAGDVVPAEALFSPRVLAHFLRP
ncbi:MAG: FAD-dependent monooxygenase, partial [Gemmatimonadetes bacterium]|nr:FAD-dependent monooxygenase [Gemmatimonadota bacterium]